MVSTEACPDFEVSMIGFKPQFHCRLPCTCDGTKERTFKFGRVSSEFEFI